LKKGNRPKRRNRGSGVKVKGHSITSDIGGGSRELRKGRKMKKDAPLPSGTSQRGDPEEKRAQEKPARKIQP